jgi:hypothetical protein
MTSKVEVSAHCPDSKQVRVVVSAGAGEVERRLLKNGETATLYIYDSRAVSAEEIDADVQGV